jgi:hypothetical protein
LNLSRQELLEGLILGKFSGERRPKAAWQALGATMSDRGFDQDAMVEMMKMQPPLEGRPPAPFETQFRGKADLLTALLGGDVAPASRPKAATALLGREPHAEVLQGLLGR